MKINRIIVYSFINNKLTRKVTTTTVPHGDVSTKVHLHMYVHVKV